MDPAQMPQGQQIQQLQLQLRQLELQIKLHQQQLQEAWQPQQQQQQQQQPQQQQQQQQQPKQQESSQPEVQKLEPQQPESQQQQQSQEQQQLPTYFTAPEMVSTLDIGYLQELLSANLLAVKQYRQATKDCQLADLKQQFKEAGKMHLQHYNSLLGFLNENGGVVK